MCSSSSLPSASDMPPRLRAETSSPTGVRRAILAAANPDPRTALRKEIPVPLPNCLTCGIALTRRYQESDRDWTRRRFCSRSCSARTLRGRPGRRTSTHDASWFWQQLTVQPSGCWEWSGVRSRRGYGRAYCLGRNWPTHRLAFTLANGPIPDGLHVRHDCDNPPCCNPAHLRLGTMQENRQDQIDRQRTRLGARLGERNPAARLTTQQVRLIRTVYAAGSATHRSLAAQYGVTYQTIGKIVRGQKWRTLLLA